MKYTLSIVKTFADKGLIKKSDVDRIVKASESRGISPTRIMVAEGLVSENEQARIMAEYMGLPFEEFDMLFINKDIRARVSNQFLKRHRVVPIDVDNDGIMTVAVADPTDFHSISALNCVTAAPKRLIVCNPVKIDNYVSSLFASGNTSMAIGDLTAETEAVAQKDRESQNQEEDSTVNAPAVRLVDSIIREAIPLRTSDIHIEPYEFKVRVRYRIDGDLVEKFDFPTTSYPAVLARIKILSGINIAERRIPQDGRIEMTIANVEYDFRVSTLPTAHGEKVVIRILDKNAFAMSRNKLGFSERENLMINRFLAQPHGIILLTGPTGSGKSTTLYSFLQELNKPSVNIITVEDPIEYTIPGINQVQVNNKAGLTFASALRSILRQDPNIIMIGEIRDEETASIATRAAITGHLVFSTLHTNDAPGSITRLLDMHIEPYLLSDALTGVISQRLVRKLCPHCKEKVLTGPNLTKSLGLDAPTEIYEQRGCKFCNYTGYRGRTGVHEVLAINEPLKAAIAEQRNLDDLRAIAMDGGLIPLWDSAKALVLDGTTSVSELLSITEK